jgi:hypothetical protein
MFKYIRASKSLFNIIGLLTALVIGSAVLLIPQPAIASQLRIVPSDRELGINQVVSFELFIDTEGTSINAFEGDLIFPADLMQFEGVEDGNSVVSYWIESPAALEDRVPFSGITVGGYRGGAGKLFQVKFSARQPGEAVVSLANLRVLINDGHGTADLVTVEPAQIVIGSEVRGGRNEIATTDTTPPEDFVPLIDRSEYIFDGQWFLSFATQDKGVGIAGYRIKEVAPTVYFVSKFVPIFSGENWTTAESPYLLKDQTLTSYIIVRAEDLKGNARTIEVSPRNSPAWYENTWIWVLLGGLSLFVYMYRVRKLGKM